MQRAWTTPLSPRGFCGNKAEEVQNLSHGNHHTYLSKINTGHGCLPRGAVPPVNLNREEESVRDTSLAKAGGCHPNILTSFPRKQKRESTGKYRVFEALGATSYPPKNQKSH